MERVLPIVAQIKRQEWARALSSKRRKKPNIIIEVQNVIKELNNWKAPVHNKITAKIIKIYKEEGRLKNGT